MIPQNYKSDFKFLMRRYKRVKGSDKLTAVPFPDCDWRLRLTTQHSVRRYEAAYIGGVMTNCARTDDGALIVMMDNHGLSCGELRYEFHFETVDPAMASGTADLYAPGSTGIMLTSDAGCTCGGLIDVQVLAPIYGIDKIVDELRRPIDDAADRAETAADKAETAAVKAEAASKKGSMTELPFLFVPDLGWAEEPKDGTIGFVRDESVFRRYDADSTEWIVIGPEDGGYNELYDDGEIRASRKVRFRCFNTIYRFTGRWLVNVALEQYGEPLRASAKTPSIHAQPGIAYRNAGYIRVPATVQYGTCRVSLKDIFIQRTTEELIPLSQGVAEAPRHDQDRIDVDQEADDVVISHRVDGLPSALSYTGLTSPYVACRYNSKGWKIFYPVYKHFGIDGPSAEDIKISITGEFSQRRFQIASRSEKDVEAQVWRRNRSRNGTPRYLAAQGFPLKKKDIYRWKNINQGAGLKVPRKCDLIRVRYCLGREKRKKSSWVYFHMSQSNNSPEFRLRPAKQIKWA